MTQLHVWTLCHAEIRHKDLGHYGLGHYYAVPFLSLISSCISQFNFSLVGNFEFMTLAVTKKFPRRSLKSRLRQMFAENIDE